MADFDVLALVGSAGGSAAALEVLRTLPPDFEVPIVVVLHLPPDSTLPEIYSRLPFAVQWARSGASILPGQIAICPPRAFLELLPDGSYALTPCETGAIERPIDRFLESVAHSFSTRAIAIVLSGMGRDGALGAMELHRTGGRVLAQSEETAEQPSMPAAVIDSGAADMVVPLHELGHLVGELVARTPRPRMRSEVESIRRTFGDAAEVAARAREIDWSLTALGPAVSWPEALRAAARTALDAPTPMAVWWGPQFIQIYNDAWRAFLGVSKHPQALGAPAQETWPEIWPHIGPLVQRVLSEGIAASGDDYPLLVQRYGFSEEVFAAFSYSPIRDATGAVVGVFNSVWETTKNVVSERRLLALRALTSKLAGAQGVLDACERVGTALASYPQDVPFALIYLIDERTRQATLAASTGIEAGAGSAPRVLDLDSDALWPIASALSGSIIDGSEGLFIDDLANRCPGLSPVPHVRGGGLPPQTAQLRPIRAATDEPPLGVVVLALSPHRPWDEAYRSFIDLVVRQISAGLAEGQAKERERERLDRLADVDRAKTEFFANVSHEFRTPLTLLLAPLDELVRSKDLLPAPLAEEVKVAASNARRLQSLVTNLLDFSQIESRRQPPQLALTDLCMLTVDVASHFRSAIEAAGLEFQIHSDPEMPLVPVEPDMWRSLVSNLLANALKFTFEGSITVQLLALRLHAEVVISDTGVGIPSDELPNIFKRFHRVRGTRARTAEGAGIGLSIVHDLISRMGGQIRVRSREGHGTAFTIWMPYKSFRYTKQTPARGIVMPSKDIVADLAEQATRWVTDIKPEAVGVLEDLVGRHHEASFIGAPQNGRIVVVDDNADVRRYLRRLLGERWSVETVAQADAALGLIASWRPDVVLADVMMPGMDGFELLRRVRADPALKCTPVMLVTARAGETAAVEGLVAGADDYVAKPFSPRELLARVAALIERARSAAALRESEMRFRAFVSASSDVVYRMSADWSEMLELNGRGLLPDMKAASEGWMTGYIHPDDQADVQAAIKRAVAGKHMFELEHRVRRLDGTLGWTLSRALPMLDDAGNIKEWLGAASDVTARKQAEEAFRDSERLLQRSQHWIAAQRDAFQAAMSGAPIETSLGILTETLVAQADDGRRCAFYIAEGNTLRHVVGMSDAYARCVDGFIISPESLACGLAVAMDQPVITPDIFMEPKWRNWLWLASQFGYRGCWSFPVKTRDGRLVGALAMYFADTREPCASDLELAQTFAETAAIIISRDVNAGAAEPARV